MARIAINAMSLRYGGGLQVMAGLLARFTPRNRYSVLWTDPQSLEILQRIAGTRDHIEYVNPLGNTNNAAIFAWGMLRQKAWLSSAKIDCILGVNHHFPSGPIPQIVYHLNVLRFDRPHHSLRQSGELADRLRDWRAGKAIRNADANLFESNLLLETAKHTSGSIRNPRVVYIGLDDTRHAPRPSSLSGDNAFAILAVTSAAPHKDNATLVRMLAELVKLQPTAPWKLRIAGGNGVASFADLQALAIKLNVAARIEYLGFLQHGDLSALGAKSLCLVSTSLAESFCMVALEAMSWGCPVVVSDTSSMPESVATAGLLARPSDPVSFAAHVMSLRDAQVRQMLVERGLTRAANLTWTSAAAEVEDAIENSLTELRA
jgi:glycosyltransferase involved in cell wall biosynthesis